MSQRRVDRLLAQACNEIGICHTCIHRRQERRRGLARVPHDTGDIPKVRRRQRTAEQGQIRRVCMAVRIVDGVETEFRIHGNADTDADDAAIEQHAVGLPAFRECRHVGARRIGAIVGAENGVIALRRVETCTHMRWRDRPRVFLPMATVARTSVTADVLEECVVRIDGSARRVRAQCAAGVRGRERITAAILQTRIRRLRRGARDE